MKMKKTRENRLNNEHRDESQRFKAYFALMFPRKVADLQKQEKRLQNLYSFVEVTFIEY